MDIELPTKTMMINIYASLYDLSKIEAKNKVNDDDNFFCKLMNLKPKTAEILYKHRLTTRF